MHEAAADLRFEYAARLRDEINDLKRELRSVGLSSVPSPYLRRHLDVSCADPPPMKRVPSLGRAMGDDRRDVAIVLGVVVLLGLPHLLLGPSITADDWVWIRNGEFLGWWDAGGSPPGRAARAPSPCTPSCSASAAPTRSRTPSCRWRCGRSPRSPSCSRCARCSTAASPS